MRAQLLGGHLVNQGIGLAVAGPLIFEPVFEGNLEERAGQGYEDDFGVDNDDSCAILLSINRKITFSGAAPSVLFSQARVTWGAGRGGAGNNQKVFDIGKGGTTLVLGATNYLKVEIAHVVIGAGAFAPASFDLSWVNFGGSTVFPVYLTERIGTIPAGGNSGIFTMPEYAANGIISRNAAPNLTDTISFFQDPAATVLFNRQRGQRDGSAQVPAGGEFYTVQNNSGTPQDYIVIWELR